MRFQICIAGWSDLIRELRRLNDTLSKLSTETDFTSEDEKAKASLQQVKDAQGRLPSDK